MPLLKLSSIESYYGPVMAVQGISLEVEQGDIVTILGANGAGKTTILKTISGVMDPEKGSIEFQGQRIDRLPPEQIVKLGISHVPEGREIFPDLTVRENLMMGAYVRRDRSAIAGDFETVYGHFPILRQRTSQLAGSMSGGEQ
ncbi:MAG: ATP-binding cassette domain-containing protein, partial [Proteobacteria bacterium]|nr:ATP-binding cassette domain-containing protein [Pseudomonadota bacterium]